MLNKKLWTGINPYLTSLDFPIETKGKGKKYKEAIQDIKISVEKIQKTIGNKQRIDNIKN